MSSTSWVPAAKRLVDRKHWTLGYAATDYPGDTRAEESIENYGRLINAYVDFAFLLQPDGSFTGQINQDIFDLALSRNIAPLILFHNFTGGKFNAQVLQTVLGTPQLRNACIDHMINSLPSQAAGVHIDFENVPAGLRLPLIDFLEELQACLHLRGWLLTMAIPAKCNEWEAPGFDFARIGAICDAVVLMTYDEHYGGGEPGPVASLPWMTQALDYAIQFIPGSKLLLGIPVYGFDWSSTSAIMVPMRSINPLVAKTGAHRLWSDPFVEPYFHYWSGREKHVVWFENELSSKIRFGFVKTYRLRGIAIWRLGYETKLFWRNVAAKFQ